MKYEAIEENSSIFEVEKMCRALDLKAPNYYRWKRQRDKGSEKRIQELLEIKKIERVFKERHKTYGYRKIAKELEKEGYEISEYKVRRLMRENGFYPETQRKYKPTHNGKITGIYSRNRLEQNFRTKRRNEVWIGDITYVKSEIGWIYLAVVIDLYNREIIGYEISKKIDTKLVKRALANAIARNGLREGMIFHSDRGCQYASKGYRQMLEENGIFSQYEQTRMPVRQFMCGKFFCNHKKRENLSSKICYNGRGKKDMFQYIELFYNRKRMHSVLGYMSPVAYRLKYDGSEVV